MKLSTLQHVIRNHTGTAEQLLITIDMLLQEEGKLECGGLNDPHIRQVILALTNVVFGTREEDFRDPGKVQGLFANVVDKTTELYWRNKYTEKQAEQVSA